VDVDRPRSEVFAYLTDTDPLHEWQPSVAQADWQGARAVGTRIRERRRFLGHRLEMELE